MSVDNGCLHNFTTRPLTEADSASYRQLRQRILHSKDAQYFSDSYERERQLSETQWLEWCREKQEHCILGTFAEDELAGIIMVTRQGDEQSPLVEWEAAYLDPRFRGTGIGKLTYGKAKEWTISRGYQYVVGFIRASYTPALDICRGMGFAYVYSIKDELWADGSIADTEAFILDLRPDAAMFAGQPVKRRFAEAFPYLNQGLHAPSEDDAVWKVA